jgi:hypothetical protein
LALRAVPALRTALGRTQNNPPRASNSEPSQCEGLPRHATRVPDFFHPASATDTGSKIHLRFGFGVVFQRLLSRRASQGKTARRESPVRARAGRFSRPASWMSASGLFQKRRIERMQEQMALGTFTPYGAQAPKRKYPVVRGRLCPVWGRTPRSSRTPEPPAAFHQVLPERISDGSGRAATNPKRPVISPCTATDTKKSPYNPGDETKKSQCKTLTY